MLAPWAPARPSRRPLGPSKPRAPSLRFDSHDDNVPYPWFSLPFPFPFPFSRTLSVSAHTSLYIMLNLVIKFCAELVLPRFVDLLAHRLRLYEGVGELIT